MKLCNLASLDPEIVESGRTGLAGASAADRAIWEEMHADWPAFAAAAEECAREIGIPPNFEDAQVEIDAEPDYTGSERAVTRQERVGQQLFRKAVLTAYDSRCCITGLDVPRMLVASHIVPWRDEPENRLNPSNGLCLSALHDRAFDIGLITIREDWTVAVSPTLGDERSKFWIQAIDAYEGKAITVPNKFQPNLEYLAHHRARIFQQ